MAAQRALRANVAAISKFAVGLYGELAHDRADVRL
jgi:hypothetical protein